MLDTFYHKIYEDNKLYELSILKPEIKDIKLNELTDTNDIFSKWNFTSSVEGIAIIRNDSKNPVIPSTDSHYRGKLVLETYDEYLEKMKNIPEFTYKWVHNIIDGVAEQNNIITRTDEYIIIPPLKAHKKTNKNNKHILVIFTDKTLRTLRDLNSTHIEMLKRSYYDTIKHEFNGDFDEVKAYFHYPPSAYSLHLHFSYNENHCAKSSVEYSHEVRNVIENLQIYTDYYKKIKMLTSIPKEKND